MLLNDFVAAKVSKGSESQHFGIPGTGSGIQKFTDKLHCYGVSRVSQRHQRHRLMVPCRPHEMKLNKFYCHVQIYRTFKASSKAELRLAAATAGAAATTAIVGFRH